MGPIQEKKNLSLSVKWDFQAYMTPMVHVICTFAVLFSVSIKQLDSALQYKMQVSHMLTEYFKLGPSKITLSILYR